MSPRSPRRVRRALAQALAVAVLVGSTYIALAAPAAQAAAGTDSSITVDWATGDVTLGRDATATAAEVKAANPDHRALTADAEGNDAGSGHWDDFQKLRVTVSDTTGLLDQGVVVSATGMKPTKTQYDVGSSNFLQVMQCWGDPASADFAKTCQWGGYSNDDAGTILGRSYTTLIGDGNAATLGRGSWDGKVNVRFRSVQGVENVDEAGSNGAGSNRGLGRFFTSSSSGELPFIPVTADGTASETVTVQSAAAQPYLGCGDPAAAGQRCWLVIVPRGEHSGNLRGDPKNTCIGWAAVNDVFGQERIDQLGSPISPGCSFWQDRIVVPMDFVNPYATCAAGAERRMVGSELVAAAMSSWQSTLCAQTGTTYSLTTNSGNLARAQLLQGQAGLVAVSQAVTADTIGTADESLIDGTDLRYAPLANTSLGIGFVIEQRDATKTRTLRLTPRLIAKMLTQSYLYDVPFRFGTENTISESQKHLAWDAVFLDPEWAALGNPTDVQDTVAKGAWVVAGPQGDDAVRALWQYVLADADAVAFLRGELDPWGGRVNRYYLPPGDPDALGGGYDLLSTALDTFPKADQTKQPSKSYADAHMRGQQIDSVAYAPYSGSFAANASRIARVDLRATYGWDPDKMTSTTDRGDWIRDAPAPPGNNSGRSILGPVSASDADLYHLQLAQLALPLTSTTAKDSVLSARQFVAPTDESVSSALSAQRVDTATGIATTDFGALRDGQYPLTLTLYAAANLAPSALTDAARQDYAKLLDYAAGPGNVRGSVRGNLPAGFVPLTETQMSQTRGLATALRAAPAAPSSGSVAAGVAAAPVAPPPAAPPASSPAPATSVSVSAVRTVATTGSAAGSVGVGGALIGGLAGLVLTPFLLRRRSMTG